MLDLHEKNVNQLLNAWTSFFGPNLTSNSIPKSSYKLPNVHAPSGLNHAKEDNNAW
jgi:hypothetical protein